MDQSRLDIIAGNDDGETQPQATKRWIGIHFDCCGAYGRIYRDLHQTAYVGACPRCLRRIEVPVGPHGTPQRIFRAS